MALENRLKEYRARLGIKSEEQWGNWQVTCVCASALSLCRTGQISLIERGDYSPSVTLALKLAKICQVTVEDIFTYTEDGEDE